MTKNKQSFIFSRTAGRARANRSRLHGSNARRNVSKHGITRENMDSHEVARTFKGPLGMSPASPHVARAHGTINASGIIQPGVAPSLPRRLSGFSTKADEIVHIQDVEPGRDVLPFGGDFGMETIKVLASFGIGRPAVVLITGPEDDFRFGALVSGVSLDPFEDFTIAFAGG